jgi:hypothetical protein
MRYVLLVVSACAVIALAALVGTSVFAAPSAGDKAASSCCFPGSPCCEPGAGCCGAACDADAAAKPALSDRAACCSVAPSKAAEAVACAATGCDGGCCGDACAACCPS